jgi:hypothetical protein
LDSAGVLVRTENGALADLDILRVSHYSPPYLTSAITQGDLVDTNSHRLAQSSATMGGLDTLLQWVFLQIRLVHKLGAMRHSQ